MEYTRVMNEDFELAASIIHYLPVTYLTIQVTIHLRRLLASRKLRFQRITSWSRSKSSCRDDCLSWGTEPGRDQVAGTCSRSSLRRWTPWGSLERSDHSRRSYSTCSH
ncbi:hypothetical protein F5X96DRAFT_626295 [Biscogniauxia mediterranea]|nr:hypothetical protein F5X96DRAFT_626295 [Biscogniauxia mediterranea]